MTLIQIIKSIFIECPRLTKGHCTMITKITKEREVCCVEKDTHFHFGEIFVHGFLCLLFPEVLFDNI